MYHFKDLGWFWIDAFKNPKEKCAFEKLKDDIAKLGIEHKYPLSKELE